MVTTRFDKPSITARTMRHASRGGHFTSIDTARVRTRGSRLLAAVAVACGLLASTAGVAHADDIKPDAATPVAGPVAKDGVRTAKPGIINGGTSEIRVAGSGKPVVPVGGVVRESQRAVPAIKGGSGAFRPGPFRRSPALGKW